MKKTKKVVLINPPKSFYTDLIMSNLLGRTIINGRDINDNNKPR